MSFDQMKNNPEVEDYFQRLPIMVQEALAQSGASFSNIQELKNVVEDLKRFRDDRKENR